jgi:putative PIN family toxin of toxin-antitoxin system
MRLVLDSNVVVSGMLWHGAPRQLLQRARVGQIHLFTSPALLSELDETLRYAKFQDKIAASGQSVQQLVALYTALASVVHAEPISRVITADPDDDAVLACALAAGAAAIVSGDKHLLDLGEWRGIEVLSVQAIWTRLNQDQRYGDSA